MTTETDTTLTPKAAGILTRAVRALIKTDPKAAAELVNDASVDALTKANDLLAAEGVGHIHDLWDGPPDSHVKTTDTGGPGSTAAPGTIPVGPGQAASGSGADRMEATYSRPAPQTGVQTAFEQLGRDVMRMHKAAKALYEVQEAHALQMSALQASLPTAESISKAVSDAIAAASMPEVIAKAVADAVEAVTLKPVLGTTEVLKAGDKKDDDDDDDDGKPPFAKSEGDEAAKAASLVALARQELTKAGEATFDGKLKKAQRHRDTAVEHMAEAEPLLAKALPATQKAYENIAKAVAAAQAKNQDEWPSSDTKPIGTAKAESGVVDSADLKSAVEAIGKAAEGLGMLSANVQQVLTAVGNGSRTGNGLPPVFSLAKAQPTDVDARMTKVRALAESGEISWNDVDATQDAVQRLRMSATGAGMPPAWAQQAILGLPEKVQTILRDAA